MINKRYLAECGDNEEKLLSKINELEARIAALESEDCEDGECNDETCPECGENQCSCEKVDDEDALIDEDDVEEIEELDFDKPMFLADDSAEADDEDNYGGLYSTSDENSDDEDDPYYN